MICFVFVYIHVQMNGCMADPLTRWTTCMLAAPPPWFATIRVEEGSCYRWTGTVVVVPRVAITKCQSTGQRVYVCTATPRQVVKPL